MKFVILGGSGQLGTVLKRELEARGHKVIVLSRSNSTWDGQILGSWTEDLEGADVVINLAGRSVNCRYTPENLKAMLDSRVNSTRVLGEAISQMSHPPRVWLQMSTATIYAHRFDSANDEATGMIGGNEPEAPAYWATSITIAKAWEQTLAEAETPQTRKVALRTAMVMSPDRGGVFDVLLGLTRKGLGGAIAGGRQYVSWIHHQDFVHAIEFLANRGDIDGAVNLCSPNPLPQREFQAILRRACGVRVGLPATAWMAKLGAMLMGTDTELILKSRRVIPGRLLEAGFKFAYPEWESAARALLNSAP